MDKRIVAIAWTLSACSQPQVTSNPPPPQPVVQPSPEPAPTAAPTTPVDMPPEARRPTSNPPPPLKVYPPVELIDGSVSRSATAVALNDTHEGATIYRVSARANECAVYNTPATSPRPPGDFGPATAVACPVTMQDPIWGLCTVGTILKDGDSCACAQIGNPPPPMQALSRCPTTPRYEPR